MSLFSLGGMDLGFCSVLRHHMAVFSFIDLKEHCCVRCSSRKLDKVILVDDTLRDANFVCRNCVKRHKEEDIFVQIELVTQMLQALNGLRMEKESIALI
jgi:hypothetical protein